MGKKFDFNDIRIQPSVITNINSRSEINIYDNRGMLPIFTAAMDTVVDEKNRTLFIDNNINVVMPRYEGKENYASQKMFVSYGLDDFIDYFIEHKPIVKASPFMHFVNIDIANGHIKKLHDTIKEAKEIYQDGIVIMAGNIANPQTYRLLSEAGASYVKVGIGNGNACLTTKQTTIGYPMASLIQECREVADTLIKPAKIVADGGMKDYSDIILSLALGADYIMIGSLLNKALESCGKTYWGWLRINQYSQFAKFLLKHKFKLTKKFRGMSTKEVQKKWGKKKLKTSEGIVTKRNVEYTLKQWVDNFKDYLHSSMSYSNALTLKEFKEKTEIIHITNSSYKRFDK